MYDQGFNEFILNDLQNFFYQYPQSQFGLKHLNDRYNSNVHDVLMKLENMKYIIRSKMMVNSKPVTHWQYNEHFLKLNQPPYNVETKFHNDNLSFIHDPIRIKISNNKRDVFLNDRSDNKLRYSNNMCTENHSPNEIIEESNKQYVVRKRLLKSSSSDRGQMTSNFSYQVKNSDTDFPVKSKEMYPQTNSVEIDSTQKTRIFNRAPKPSNLNINSPPFVPKTKNDMNNSEKKLEQQSDSKSYSDPSVNNFSLAFMTAMNKNPVSVLFEFCQQRGLDCEFKTLEMEGPAHKPRISTAVIMNGKQYETVVASNKKEAKRNAADSVIRQLISEGYFSQKPSHKQPLPKNRIEENRTSITNSLNKETFGNPLLMYNLIASLVYNKLAEIMNGLSPNDGLSLAGRKVVSAIIMQNVKYETLDVVSLATGNRCITGDKLSLHGKIINDSHAEVVARRAFLFFLYNRLDAHISGSAGSIDLFEEVEIANSMSLKRQFKIKDYIKFHFFISTAPCGDGALFCSKESITPNYETKVVLSTEHDPINENNSQGLLRTKMEGGEGTIPVSLSDDCKQMQTLDGILHGERLRTMSCSDKIARWNYLGLQGNLLSFLMQPIYIKSLILGNLFNAGHLCRAVCCRLEKYRVSPFRGRCSVNHPDLINVYVGEQNREIDKSNELSINWCYGENVEVVDGVTGTLSMKTKPHSNMSRLSKASLFREFHKIYNKMCCTLTIEDMSYTEVKSLSIDYEEKKKALFLKFHCAKYGSWICKPIEQSQFKNVNTVT